MAVAGLITESIKAQYPSNGNSLPIGHAPEGSSQAFIAGAPLIISSGNAVVAASPPFDTGDAIIGIATHAASGVATRNVTFVRTMRNVVFEATLEDSSANGYALVQGDLHAIYAIDYDATNKKYYIDHANTTNPIARIIAFVDPVGTVRARVRFVFTGGIAY